MDRPRPVPGGCIDTTPADMWDTLWLVDPEGNLSMPTETWGKGQQRIRFWKAHFTSDKHHPKMPFRFWNVYWSKYPQGHPEDNTPTMYVPKDVWDDSKHGYFHSNGRLIFKHPNGTIFCGVTGADQF